MNKDENKTERWSARVNEAERVELDQIAAVLDVPASQIVREAVREKIEKLQRTHPKLKNRAAEVAEVV